MIVEWLAPAAALALSARLLWLHRRPERSVAGVLQTGGALVASYFLVSSSFDLTGSLVGSLVFAPITLSLAVIPARTAMRLIGAGRPNEIEDPELFEDGELKPPEELKQLRDPSQD